MERNQYHRNFWIKLCGLFCIVPLVTVCCPTRQKEIPFANDHIDTLWSTARTFIALDINYKDSIYRVLLDECAFSMFPEVSDKKLRSEIFSILKTDTLNVTPTVFEQIRKYGEFVIGCPKVDSIRNGNHSNLIDYYFNEYGHWEKVELDRSIEEKNYLIYSLFKDGVSLMQDCESGFLFIRGYHNP